MTGNASLRSAVKWSYAMDGGRQVITSAITVVLAALVGPEVFGVMAMALVYVLFLELLLKQGMGAAVIQRKDLRPAHLDSAFWMVMAVALVLMVVSAALSGWWATVNRTPELQAVILGLTAMIPLQGLLVVQEANLRRQLRFRALALRTNLSAVVGGALGVAMALAGFGVWALVAQQISTVFVAVIVLWTVSEWRPRLRFSWAAGRELLGFSSGSFLASLGVFVNSRSDALLIGLLFGPLVVGLYRLATRLVDTVIGITVRALTAVSLPELSRAQDDPARFRASVLWMTWLSAVLALPALGVLAGASEPILGLLGEEWLPAAPALRLVCIAGGVHALFAFTGTMLQALGRPHQQAALAWLFAALSAGGFLIAGVMVRDASVGVQLSGLALSRVLVYGVVVGAICMVLIVRVSDVTVGRWLRAVAPALGASGLAAIVGSSVSTMADIDTLNPWLAVALPAAGATLVAVVALALSDSTFRGFSASLWPGNR